MTQKKGRSNSVLLPGSVLKQPPLISETFFDSWLKCSVVAFPLSIDTQNTLCQCSAYASFLAMEIYHKVLI